MTVIDSQNAFECFPEDSGEAGTLIKNYVGRGSGVAVYSIRVEYGFADEIEGGKSDAAIIDAALQGLRASTMR